MSKLVSLARSSMKLARGQGVLKLTICSLPSRLAMGIFLFRFKAEKSWLNIFSVKVMLSSKSQ